MSVNRWKEAAEKYNPGYIANFTLGQVIDDAFQAGAEHGYAEAMKESEDVITCLRDQYEKIQCDIEEENAALLEVARAAKMLWDAAMITVTDAADRERCDRLHAALTRLGELRTPTGTKSE